MKDVMTISIVFKKMFTSFSDVNDFFLFFSYFFLSD